MKQRNYQDWMNELQFATTVDEDPRTRLPGMVTCAVMMGKLNPKEARHDIALVLSVKYKEEMSRANGRSMLVKPIEEKYNLVAQTLFKSNFKNLLNYIIKHEPQFDIRATNIAQGKSPPGFIKADTTLNDKNEVRAPLGFVKKPGSRVDEQGNKEPSLGFLDEDITSRGTLGFL